MGRKLTQKLEFDLEATLQKTGVKDRQGSIIEPKFYVLPFFPTSIIKRLGEEAIELGYKPGEKVKYKITIKRIDE
ncbi:MAG TPA: hypothetical protein VMV95_00230 [Bacillota bacterium]|nr:hypothetical protein [Bacillota bacterium]